MDDDNDEEDAYMSLRFKRLAIPRHWRCSDDDDEAEAFAGEEECRKVDAGVPGTGGASQTGGNTSTPMPPPGDSVNLGEAGGRAPGVGGRRWFKEEEEAWLSRARRRRFNSALHR